MKKIPREIQTTKPTLEVENLNTPITSKEIELASKNYPPRKVQVQLAPLVNFTKHLKN